MRHHGLRRWLAATGRGLALTLVILAALGGAPSLAPDFAALPCVGDRVVRNAPPLTLARGLKAPPLTIALGLKAPPLT